MTRQGERTVDALALVLAKLVLAALVLRAGFTHVSDDDYARTVIAEQFAHAPRLDPSGTSWLPAPFWIAGAAMMAFGRTLDVARATAVALGAASVAAPYVALREAGVRRVTAIAATAIAMTAPWNAWLGVATVPEGWTGALVGAALIAMPVARARPWAAGALLLGALGRYETWPACAVFAALCAARSIAAMRAGGLREAARESDRREAMREDQPAATPESDRRKAAREDRQEATREAGRQAATHRQQATREAERPVAASDHPQEATREPGRRHVAASDPPQEATREAGRQVAVREALCAFVAIAGPLAWMAWNAHAHGSALHFVTRVTTFRRSIGAAAMPLADKVLGYPRALVFEMPLAAAFGAAGAVGLGSRELRARWGWPWLAALATFVFLVWGDVRDGAPTHHAARALVGIGWVLIASGVDAVAALGERAAARGNGRLRSGVGVVVVAAIVAATLLAGKTPAPGQSESEDRTAQIARGLDLRARHVPAARIVPCSFEHFALLAAWGHPERATIEARTGAPPTADCPEVDEQEAHSP